ncbi:unnamed protein product [Lactuca virosa]|uniref:Uncharacterized protein n=1 Tax=Lactuca virosa TaxID=75947 RepID=A0AAU9M9U6_9ASTR|nr:unnamed protein product [Lactuca virosa]
MGLCDALCFPPLPLIYVSASIIQSDTCPMLPPLHLFLLSEPSTTAPGGMPGVKLGSMNYRFMKLPDRRLGLAIEFRPILHLPETSLAECLLPSSVHRAFVNLTEEERHKQQIHSIRRGKLL